MKNLWVRCAAAAAMLLAWVTPAVAQEFQKVEGQVRENIPAAPFVASAYGFIWLSVFVYVGLVARRLGQVKGEIEELRRRVDRG
jgi:CcmD family protein